MELSLTLDQANRYLELSRRVRWKFPTSSGTPVPLGVDTEVLVKNRGAFAGAAGHFMDGGHEDASLALALYGDGLLAFCAGSRGDEGMITVELHNLGHVEARRGNADAAKRLFAECSSRVTAGDPYDAAMTALGGAAVASARGDLRSCAQLLSRMESILRESDISLAPDDASEADWLRRGL